MRTLLYPVFPSLGLSSFICIPFSWNIQLYPVYPRRIPSSILYCFTYAHPPLSCIPFPLSSFICIPSLGIQLYPVFPSLGIFLYLYPLSYSPSLICIPSLGISSFILYSLLWEYLYLYPSLGAPPLSCFPQAYHPLSCIPSPKRIILYPVFFTLAISSFILYSLI
ncbi:unnamed protein product [Acanthosepion pharaonis]|uniref:Uncharacterized protein n=1 Tax=Acanthosepion pharaonis TaxID=158019 RepID=A0A812DVV9_ACAPH|nr:unnamed protein product [Sepia pharaonis]